MDFYGQKISDLTMELVRALNNGVGACASLTHPTI